MAPTPKFSRVHYNAIAKDIRETLQAYLDVPAPSSSALMTLSIKLAYRFTEDNPRFDPIKFLNACSPDPDKFTLLPLWEGFLTNLARY